MDVDIIPSPIAGSVEMSSAQPPASTSQQGPMGPKSTKRRASSNPPRFPRSANRAGFPDPAQQVETPEEAAALLRQFEEAEAQLQALEQVTKATQAPRSISGGEVPTDLDETNPDLAQKLGIGFTTMPPKKTRDELAEVEAELRAKGLLEKRVDVDLTADTSDGESPAVSQRREERDRQPVPRTTVPQPPTGSIRNPAPIRSGSFGPGQPTPEVEQVSKKSESEMPTLTASWSSSAPTTAQAPPPPPPPAPAPAETPALSVIPASIINHNANPEYGPSPAASAAHATKLPKHGRNIPIRGTKLNPMDAEDCLEQFWALYPSLRFVLRRGQPLRPYLLRFGPTYDEQIAALSRESGIQAIMIPQVPAKGWWNWMEDWDTAYSSDGVEQMQCEGRFGRGVQQRRRDKLEQKPLLYRRSNGETALLDPGKIRMMGWVMVCADGEGRLVMTNMGG